MSQDECRRNQPILENDSQICAGYFEGGRSACQGLVQITVSTKKKTNYDA